MHNTGSVALCGRPERQGKTFGSDVTNAPSDRDRSRSRCVASLRSGNGKYTAHFKGNGALSRGLACLTLGRSAVDLIGDINARQRRVKLIDYRKQQRCSRLGCTDNTVFFATAARTHS